MKNFLNHFTAPDIMNNPKMTLGMPYHIFEEMLKQIKHEISQEEYMDLFYFHTIIEKSVTAWRKRELNSGAVIIKNADRLQREYFPAKAKLGAEIVYQACRAYQEYVEEQYDAAWNRLNTTIPLIKAQKEIIPAFTANLYEQNLNMMRICFKTKNSEQVAAKAKQLFSSVLFDVNDYDTFDKDLARLSQTEKNTWLHYLLDSFMFCMGNSFANNKETREQLYKDVFGSVLEQDTGNASPHRCILDGITMFYNATTNDTEHFIYNIDAHFNSLRNCPALLKKWVLSYYFHWANEQQAELETHENYEHFLAVLYEYGLKQKPRRFAGSGAAA